VSFCPNHDRESDGGVGFTVAECVFFMKCDWNVNFEDYGTDIRVNHTLLESVRLHTTRNDMAGSYM
jgi:hypothetical protein